MPHAGAQKKARMPGKKHPRSLAVRPGARLLFQQCHHFVGNIEVRGNTLDVVVVIEHFQQF
jgi:hypothetical protein